MTERNNSFRMRVARALAGRFWPAPKQTSVVGVTPGMEGVTWQHFFSDLSAERSSVYRDMEKMDDTMPEISRALDILADNAVNAPEGVKRSFHVRYDEGTFVSKGRQAIIEQCIKRTRLEEKVYSFMRESLKYGDCFVQKIVDEDYHVSRLMYMNPYSMRRNEDDYGLLKMGNTEGEWAYEQYVPSTNRFVAGFYPWQIEHLRWGRSGMSKYGRPALSTARYPFKKLQAMEEALVVNWLTRAFARLLFQIDITGMSRPQAEAHVRQFKEALTRRQAGAEREGVHRLTTVHDIFLGNGYQNLGGKYEKSLNDVQVMDTSNTGFWNITAVEYWRTKLITATGVPKAHLGIEQDINAKATLQWQDERFARTIRRVQMLASELIHNVIDLELVLQGIDPTTVDYVVEWPSPSMQDDESQAQVVKDLADASRDLIGNGIMSPDQVRELLFHMTPAQRQAATQYYTGRADDGASG